VCFADDSGLEQSLFLRAPALHKLGNLCMIILEGILSFAAFVLFNLTQDRKYILPVLVALDETGVKSFGELNLSNRKIGVAGASALANYLSTHQGTFPSIRLRGNAMKSEGIVLLAEAFDSGVSWLDLDANEIGDTGVTALAKKLRSNRTLSRLSLKANGLTDAGIAVLARALRKNVTLKKLKLDENSGITSTGAEILIAAIRGHVSLKQISLEGTGVSHEMKRKVEAELKRSNSKRAHVLTALCYTATRSYVTDRLPNDLVRQLDTMLHDKAGAEISLATEQKSYDDLVVTNEKLYEFALAQMLVCTWLIMGALFVRSYF